MNPLSKQYQAQLFRNQQALNYLYGRGFTIETIKKFELGYAGSNAKEISNSHAKRLGLVSVYENKPYAFFNNRIMIPIRNNNGKTAGFTGRTLLPFDNIAKYKNSKDSKEFNKSKILYNLHSIIGNNDSVILFEGHLNVLAYHQTLHGIQGSTPHPVATGGTALTTQHIEALKNRGVRSVFICFDGDKAGRNATLRAIRLLKDNFMVYVVAMPKGKDVADFINQREVLEELLFIKSFQFDDYVSTLMDFYRKNYRDRMGRDNTLSQRGYIKAMEELLELL